MHPDGNDSADGGLADSISHAARLLAFGILTWLLAMLCNLGVVIYERESAGAMVFTFMLLSVAIASWLLLFAS